MLESLEERLTPSGGNPTVTQTAGDYNTLTAAVAGDTAANTNYVIQITNSFAFNFGAQVSIANLGSGSTLTIEGQNGTNFTLFGNHNRLFAIGSGQTVTFADLTLAGGNTVSTGGAIQDQGGNVTLSKVVVQNNIAQGATAAGGGVYASGAGSLTIRDSILSGNRAQGSRGADGTALGSNGGSAYGGGLYVVGSGWTVTLIGDTLAGNTALGGNGGNGAMGSNATAPNTSGGIGGGGGSGGTAEGGAAYFSVSSGGSGNLTILNDLSAPLSGPSTMIDNFVYGGTGGTGGAGGNSTGKAPNTFGGSGGLGGIAEGGALYVGSAAGATLNGNIGNSAFYANEATGGNNGEDGAEGTGGGVNPANLRAQPPPGSDAAGGALAFVDGNITMVNCTVAKNTVSAGFGAFNGLQGSVWGGGIYDNDAATVVLDNNTITQNTISGGNDFHQGVPDPNGTGVFVASGSPTLVNNLILGNRGFDLLANTPLSDLASASNATLSNANHNFIGTINPSNAVSTTTNIVGNPQAQLGSVVGLDVNGKPTGGPIYYPLLPGVVALGSGSVSVLSTIAAVEGTSVANVVDAIGNPRSTNGSIDLGPVQSVSSLSPSPPPPTLSPFQLLVAITIDLDAFVLQELPPALSFLNAVSERLLGLPLPATADLIPTIEGDLASLVRILIRII
jgi:hypothetical protein